MSLATILHGTPIWVWVLLVVLLSRGIKALKSGTTPLAKLAVVPIIFAVWGIVHLAADPSTGWPTPLAWVAGALAGIVGGVVLARRTRFIVDPVANTVMLPGSMVPLVLIVVTFATKFWLGVELATATASTPVLTYLVIEAAVSGIVAGIFGGRFFTYWGALARLRGSLPA
ncbi:DUF6622 family protein [Paraburkholderia sp. DHOC27]|uniref:DUF6622 family protein n=1 Tax=Paraburkholderia sp. DHOC27 TaxID=2303330 RepID=UPI000E3D53B1|nr:DUF6622 family protein [Paraburkholderia sp. DHOC27]RFU49583.1 hypothetical protein D0B32_07305 [Paraburkholderia sp. DHOC27]